nr:hypothetical protein [Acidobacteriota bacterium]
MSDVWGNPESMGIRDGVLWVRPRIGPLRQIPLAHLRHLRVILTRGRDGRIQRCLEVDATRLVRVSMEAEGVEEVLAVLERWTGFDREALERGRTEDAPQWIDVWRRELVVNAMLLNESSEMALREFVVGPVLLPCEGRALERQLLWETTFDAILEMPGTRRIENELGNLELEVGPVRLCGVAMQSLRVSWPTRRHDVPVDAWRSLVTVATVWGQSYWVLKEHLMAIFGPQDPDWGSYERSDQNSQRWNADGLWMQLVTLHDSELRAATGYCSVSVMNLRRYAEYLEDGYTRSLGEGGRDALQLEL